MSQMPDVFAVAEVFAIVDSVGMGNKIVTYGSRFVCDPPVLDTDIDLFFMIPEGKSQKDLTIALTAKGFVEHEEIGPDSSRPSWGDADPDRRFSSWRKDKINLVITESPVFASRHIAATRLCKRLNLLDKKDRVAVYQAVLYGKSPE